MNISGDWQKCFISTPFCLLAPKTLGRTILHVDTAFVPQLHYFYF